MILSEFLNKSYRNLEQIYKLIKDKLPIYKDAIYSDPNNIIIPAKDGESNREKFAELNRYLANTYNMFINYGYKGTLYASDVEDAERATSVEKYNQAIANYFREHPELEGHGIQFDWYGLNGNDITDKKYDNSLPYYHVSDVPPKIILKVGLKAHDAVYRNDSYSYNKAVFLFSLARATAYNDSRAEGDKLSPVQIVADNMEAYHGKSDTISYIYKVTLPKGVRANTDSAATWWRSATFVEENIRPENIQCIGYYQPYNNKGLKTGYFTGDNTQVHDFADIIEQDTPMKDVTLKSTSEFKAESYGIRLKQYFTNTLLPRANEIIKPIEEKGYYDWHIDYAVEEPYKNVSEFIDGKLAEGLSPKEIIIELKELIIKRILKDNYEIKRGSKELPQIEAELASDRAKLKKLKSVPRSEFSTDYDYDEHMYRIEDFSERVKDKSIRVRKLKQLLQVFDDIKEQIYAI